MQGSHQTISHASLKSESVWFKTKLISQFLILSFLLTQPFYLSYLHAAPIGGDVVGGTGSISQSDLTTTINQTSQNVAIDWQSFNVNTNEQVKFVQPNSSSIALNRIIGNNGSVIQGKIDANGQVFLINPNGILFTSSARVNVGGLVASSLDLTTSDFMNGNYIFNEVLTSNGAVINSGLITASLGGNVALIGKQVKNDGVISANLGSIILAAGKQSVLTFDNQGLIGVKVTKEVLQKELGLEEAIVNNGEINASGGRVLLTASTSQDVFSQAVNTNQLDQASSVVVHADGSFTLGGGANVLNTGYIDVSSQFPIENTTSDNTARIIILGENVTSSGSIKADSNNGNAGEIEIHANNQTLLIKNSITSAVSLATGKGGLIKILGDKVGLFDQSTINASGANGGGEVLFGGDRQGLNTNIRNADFVFLGEDTTVKTDAVDNGDGGKIITFAKDTARIHGNLFSRGGLNSGKGGFVETSGLRGFEITNAPDVSAFNGNGGLWLIDPNNIRIVNDGVAASININTGGSPFRTNEDGAILGVGLIETALGGGNVLIETTMSGADTESGNISFEANLNFNSAGNNDRLLTLKSHNDITFTGTSSITDSDRSTGGTRTKLSLDLEADSDNSGSGNVSLSTNATGINLFGGMLDIVNAQNISFNGGSINTFDSTATSGGGDLVISQAAAVTFNGATINTAGNKVDIKNSTSVAFNGGMISTNGDDVKIVTTGDVTSTNPTTNLITTSGGNFIVKQATNFDSSNVIIDVGFNADIDLGKDGSGDPGVTGNVVLGDLISSTQDLFITKATFISQSAGSNIFIARDTDLQTSAATNSIILENTTNNFVNLKLRGAEVSIVDVNEIRISSGTNVSDSLKIKASGNISNLGNVVVSNTIKDAVAIFDTTINSTTFGNVILNNDNDFNNVKILNANNVVLRDSTAGIAIEANDGTNSGGIRGTLTVDSIGVGDITDMKGVVIPNSGGQLFTGEVNVGGANSFSVADNQSIILDTENNTFGGDVTFLPLSSRTSTISNITINDSDNILNLSDISVAGDLKVTAGEIVFQDTHATNLEATTNVAIATGNITQTNHLRISGTTTIDSFGNVTLERADNDFSNVTISSGNIVSLRDTDAIRLISSNTNSDLQLQAAGDISLVGNISTNNNSATNAGNVLFIGDVLLAPTASTFPGNTIEINTNATGVLTDGTVTFTGTIDNNEITTTVRNNLKIISGDGNIDFQDRIGTEANIASLVINDGLTSNAIVNLKRVRTQAKDSSATNNAIDITAGTINLSENLETNGGRSVLARGVSLNGNVLISSDITIDTTNSLSDGAVTIVGAVNSSTTARKLTINSDTGAVNLQQSQVGNSNALSALEINSGSGNGTVNLNTVTTVGGNNVISIDGSTINLNGNITSNSGGAGGDIRFDGDLILNNSVVISSVGTSSNGQVDINGNVNGNNTLNSNSLTIISGDSNVNLNNVGNNEAIQKLTVNNTSGDINVGSINTRDNATDTGVVLTSTGTINLGGNITTNVIGANGSAAGIVDINGVAVLNSNVIISTNAVTSSGSVVFSKTVDADSAGNDRNLTINTGTASLTFNDDVGANQALDSLVVNNTGTTSLKNVNARTGGVDITSTTINLEGNLNTKDQAAAGQIRLIGAVNINADTTFDTDGSGLDNNIFINGAVNNTISRALVLNTGSANIALTGVAGNGVALKSLTATGNNIDLGQVTTLNAIDITGNNIGLAGNLTTTSAAVGNIDLKNGAVTLKDDVTLSVVGSNNITVDGAINSDLASNSRSFTINSGIGIVDLKSDIGTAVNSAIQALKITNAGTTNLQSVTSRFGGIDVTTNSLNLSGNLLTTDNVVAGNIRLAAQKIDLFSNVILDTDSTTSDGFINIINPGASIGIEAGTNSLTISSGTANTTISQNINNIGQFNLSSSGTALLSSINSSATINANASNGLTLNGAFNAITASNEVINFNADSDANGAGSLTFSDGASFLNTSGPISFTGALLAANNNFSIRAGASGSDTVLFNSTNNLSIGTAAIGFRLSNLQLSNITASSINLSAANDLFFSDVSQSSGPNFVMSAANIRNLGTTTSLFRQLNATATNIFNVGANITTANNLELTGATLNISENHILESINGDVILNGAITGANGQLNLFANNSNVTLSAGSTVNNLNSLNVIANTIDLGDGSIHTINDINLTVLSNASTYNQNVSMDSQLGNITINAGDNNVVMTNGITINAANDITISTTNGGIALSLVETTSGLISVNAVNGSITDSNGGSVNVTSNGTVNLTATGGIGSGDPLELAMNGPKAKLSAANNSSGNIEFINTGAIQLETIKNYVVGGTFELRNTGGDVTINSLIMDKSNATSVATFDVLGGDVLGVQPPNVGSNGNRVHVTANSAIFQMNNVGSVGQLGAPLVTDIPNKIEVISATGTFIKFFGGVPPKDFIGDNAYKNRALQAIESLSSQQLIQVESLAEIDPAIFTDVRNYSHSDIALMMPSDQRYTDEEEEDKEAKEKRQEFLNSTR